MVQELVAEHQDVFGLKVRQFPQSSDKLQHDGTSTHELVTGHKVWLPKQAGKSKQTLLTQSNETQFGGIL